MYNLWDIALSCGLERWKLQIWFNAKLLLASGIAFLVNESSQPPPQPPIISDSKYDFKEYVPCWVDLRYDRILEIPKLVIV